jgi:NADPH:quinone reductase-like Zn-dependent oxidoreductase
MEASDAPASPCNGQGVDLLFDAVGGQTRDQALDAVRDGGRAISIVLQGTPLRLERGITGESFLPKAAGRGLSNWPPLSMSANSARKPKRSCRSTKPARRWRWSLPGTPEARSRSKSADCARSGRLAW